MDHIVIEALLFSIIFRDRVAHCSVNRACDLLSGVHRFDSGSRHTSYIRFWVSGSILWPAETEVLFK